MENNKEKDKVTSSGGGHIADVDDQTKSKFKSKAANEGAKKTNNRVSPKPFQFLLKEHIGDTYYKQAVELKEKDSAQIANVFL